ncbi:hypothetical protein [Streptomyces bambusae]|uniref:Ig-like domain-containing protein n=1 Tax=Streptomyces bambusae TaxID=1550616 RepID=A0ABS6ZK71_9ACTN|nr:hypothetical protein [Streptomyces bambusae]MBW5487010.1 hypothetical protein [Streptomyces bambusae]
MTGEATVTVEAKGGPVPVVLEWFTSNSPRLLGSSDGRETVTYQPGLVRTHSFKGTGCYWYVRATAGGRSSTSAPVWIRSCQIR